MDEKLFEQIRCKWLAGKFSKPELVDAIYWALVETHPSLASLILVLGT